MQSAVNLNSCTCLLRGSLAVLTQKIDTYCVRAFQGISRQVVFRGDWFPLLGHLHLSSSCYVSSDFEVTNATTDQQRQRILLSVIHYLLLSLLMNRQCEIISGRRPQANRTSTRESWPAVWGFEPATVMTKCHSCICLTAIVYYHSLPW